MTDRSTQLTRRRLLGGILTVAGASAATGAGTMAYFSDSESSSGNTVQAGTLDLSFDGSSSFQFSTSLGPTETTQTSVTLVNEGSIDGSLDIDVIVTESDGDYVSPNKSATEVAQNLEVITLDYDGDRTDQITTANATPTLEDLRMTDQSDGETTPNDLVDLPNPDSTTNGGTDFTVEFRLKDVGNEFQGEGVEITFEFHLNQNDGQ